jgi:hypothetical protein
MVTKFMLDWQPTDEGKSRGMTLEWLGFIPTFVDPFNPEPAAKQIDGQYQHGGGWRPMKGWKLSDDKVLSYDPSDPPLKPLYRASHNIGGDQLEEIYFYDSAWTCIVQPDGSFEVSRLD